jgi:hypothetical protein
MLTEGNGGFFPTLSAVWDKAEDHSATWSDWHKIMVWAVFCGLHKQAIESLQSGDARIYKSKIDKVYVEKRFSESLYVLNPSYPSWMRKPYKNDLCKAEPNKRFKVARSAHSGRPQATLASAP